MIPYQRLFDFDGLEKKFGSLDAEYQKFVTNTVNGSNIVKAALSTYTKDLQTVLQELRALNLAQAGANRKYEEQTKKTEEYSKRILELKGIIATLTDAQTANEVSIEKLKGALSLLKKEYDGLDPKAADFKAQQQQIADKVKLAKQAIDAQNTTLKAANQVLGSVTNTYARLSKETNEFRNRLRNLDNAFDLNTGKINKNNKEAVALLYQIQQNDAALKRMDASMGQHQRSVGHYTTALGGLRGNFLMLTGTLFGVDSAMTAVTKTFEIINDFQRYRNALEVASGSTKRFNSNLAFLEKLANDTGTAIETLYPTFTKLEAAARGTTMQGQKVRDIFSGIVKMGASLSLTNEDVEGTLKAIEQAMSKGKIQAEEWRGQVGDRLPGAFRLLAESMGITTSELDKMMSDGKVYAEDVLPKVAAQIEKTYGDKAAKNLETMSGQTNRLKNETSLLIDEFSRDQKVNSFFGAIIKGIADTIGAWRALAKEQGFFQTMVLLGGGIASGSGLLAVNEMAKNAQKRQQGAQGLDYYGPFNGKDAAGRAQQITAQRATAQLAKQEFELFDGKYDPKKKKELLDYANEEYKRLNTIIVLNDQLLKKEKALADERAKSEKGKDKADKKELTQLETLLKDLEKLQDVLLDDALADVRNGKAVDLPQPVIDKWKSLYDVLQKVAKATGIDIPAKLREFNQQINPERLSYTANSLTPNLDTSTLTQKKPIKTADGEAQRRTILERLLLEKQFISERKDLEVEFSRSLRGLKETERNELMRLLSEIQDAELRGNKDRKDAAKAEFDYKKDLYRQDVQNRKRAVEESIELAALTVQGIFEVTNAYRDRDIARLETQKEREVKLAGDNAEAKEAIEKRMDERIREIRIKQARAQKAMSVFQIAMETAVATMRAFSEGGIIAGIPLAAIVAAQGAIRLATVLATPLPAFKKGTRYAPEGPALVAEEGAELHESQGKYFLHEKPSVVPLKRGDKIYTAAETSRMLADQYKTQELNTVIARSEIPSIMAKNLQLSQQKAQMSMSYAVAHQLNLNADRIGQTVANAVSSLPVNETHFDEDGVWERQRKVNSVVTYRKARHGF